MGIHDRDYMKRRRTDADSETSGDSEESLEGITEGYLGKYPSLPKILGVGLLILIVLALIFSRR